MAQGTGEFAVRNSLISSMRHIKDAISERDRMIPDLSRRLLDARGGRLELIEQLDALERHAEDQNISITSKDLRPPVVNGCSPDPDDDDPF